MNAAAKSRGLAALRWLIGGLLVWAALGKLANLQDFFTTLLAYRLPLAMGMLKIIAIVLPWMELLCGLLLLAGTRIQAALLWAFVLFAIFTACTGLAWIRGLHIACGCLDLRPFGIRPGSNLATFLESTGFAFLRAALLATASIVLLLRPASITPTRAPSSELRNLRPDPS